MNDITAERIDPTVEDNNDGNRGHARNKPRHSLLTGADERERNGYVTPTELPDDSEHQESTQSLAHRPSDGHIGLRLLRVVVVALCYFVIELVAKAVTVMQFVYLAWRKQPHPGMQRLGARLSEYMYAMWRYCTFASDDAPWPFKPWPKGQVDLQR